MAMGNRIPTKEEGDSHVSFYQDWLNIASQNRFPTNPLSLRGHGRAKGNTLTVTDQGFFLVVHQQRQDIRQTFRPEGEMKQVLVPRMPALFQHRDCRRQVQVPLNGNHETLCVCSLQQGMPCIDCRKRLRYRNCLCGTLLPPCP